MASHLEAELDYAAAEFEQELELETPGQPSTCNQTLMEQGVNQCIADARSCVIKAHFDLGKKLAACKMNPWCNAKAMYGYYQALAKCRDAIMPCDAAAKRRAGCV